MDHCPLPWEIGIASIAGRLEDFRDRPAELDALVRQAIGMTSGYLVRDPFHALAALMAAPDRERAFAHAATGLRLSIRVTGLEELTPLDADTMPTNDDEALVAALWDAFSDWFAAGECRSFSNLPTGSGRSALLRSLERLEGVRGASGRLPGLSVVMWWCHPRAWLPLEGPVLAMLRSPDGFGMAERDMPATAHEYLSFVEYLHAEMEAAHIPYHDFLEWWEAARTGSPLRDGLVGEARERLLREELEPALRRLYPLDCDRVQHELARLRVSSLR